MNLTHLGPYSDLIEAVRHSRQQPPPANEILRCLEFSPWPAQARDIRVERTWREGDISADEISWSCGYGPRTHAWLYSPAKASGPRPGIVLLHDHGAFKYWGKEKVADGPDGLAPGLAGNRARAYGNRSPAAALVRAGFTVLVHDAFLWGSRRVPYETIPEMDRRLGRLIQEDIDRTGDETWLALPEEVRAYNAAAICHEHTMAKYTTLLGTSLSGIVTFEDHIAVNYLRSRTDLCTGWIACAGLSGGGLRSALLRATCDNINAAVVVGMMSTYAGLLDHHVLLHTWMLFPPALARKHDWPDVVARNFKIPVLVQYDDDDPLFSPEGMHEADAHIRAAFARAGASHHYQGQFYPGPHKFDVPMQDDAIAWLRGKSAT
jgi:dienelactone hydrolase